jgi:PST family polysaccharide transporter
MNVARAARGLVVGVLLARHLGPEDFGVYAAAVGIITIIFALLPMGLDAVLIREMSQNVKNHKTLMRQGLTIRIMGFLLCSGATGVYLWLRPQNQTVVLLMGCLVAAEVAKIFLVKATILQAQHRFKEISVANIIGTMIGAGVALYGIAADMPLWFFAFALTVDAWITTGLLLVAKTSTANGSEKKTISTKELLREGIPYLITGIAILLYMKIDVVMLENMRGDREAGLYAAAVRSSEVFLLVPLSYAKVLAPRLHSETNAGFREAFCNALCWISRISLTAGVVFIGLGYITYGMIFTNAYIEGRVAFLILTASLIFSGPGLIGTILVVRTNTGWLKMTGILLAALTNIVINYLLIPSMGMYGACIATFISYAIAALLPFAVSSKLRWALGPAILSLFGIRCHPKASQDEDDPNADFMHP